LAGPKSGQGCEFRSMAAAIFHDVQRRGRREPSFQFRIVFTVEAMRLVVLKLESKTEVVSC
jgi:hypothetical protein